MNNQQRDRLSSLAKHIVTLSLGALGFVITIMFTSVDSELLTSVTAYKKSLQSSLIFFFGTVLLGILVEGAVVSDSLESRTSRVSPVTLLFLSWISFVSGCVSLIVFALAITYGLPAL